MLETAEAGASVPSLPEVPFAGKGEGGGGAIHDEAEGEELDDDEPGKITKLEQTMSDLQVEEEREGLPADAPRREEEGGDDSMLRGISSLEFEASLSMIGSGGGSSSSVDGGRPGRLPMGGAGLVFKAGTERGPDVVGEGVAEGGTEGEVEGGREGEVEDKVLMARLQDYFQVNVSGPEARKGEGEEKSRRAGEQQWGFSSLLRSG
jgi:hypothetical protein